MKKLSIMPSSIILKTINVLHLNQVFCPGTHVKQSYCQHLCVNGELLSMLENYRENCNQKIVLNGQTSEWRKMDSEVPQGLVLVPLLFLIYINHLPDNVSL